MKMLKKFFENVKNPKNNFGARLQFNVENVATFAFDSKANYDLGGKVKPNYVWGLYLNF